MEKIFQPQKIEKRIRNKWKKFKIGNPEKIKAKKVFSMIMPPPNANGKLHMGHALMLTLEDIIARFERMNNKKVLWLPGFDHAGFETLVVFEKELEKQGKSRFDFSPKELYKLIFKFVQEKKKEIKKQMETLGISVSWEYERFTLEKPLIKLVLQTFNKLKADGLIEEGTRLVNWCVKHQTSFSDLEIIFKEKKDFLYYIQYGPVKIATVRPETILADVAFAVNPNDSRYKDLIGKKLEFKHPLTEEKVVFPVVSDKGIDPNFGTGVLKVTPGHDFFDFYLAEKFNLPIIHIFDEKGRINIQSPYLGLKVSEAREKIVEDLKSKGLILKQEEYIHSVPVCYKCEKEIEPRPMRQWFLLVDKKFKLSPKLKKLVGKKEASLKEITISALRKNLISFYPPRFKKLLLNWLVNLKDWNISRQVVWGIPIPGSNDVFDTWFSSAQWPVITLQSFGPKVFKKYYPTDVMETGYDILYFWVSRMIFMGLYLTGDVPFRKVLLHGLVRDEKGQKMSKSKGNVIDPLEIVNRFGNDVLRVALVMGSEIGKDVIISEKKFIGAQRFLNKIWNATRFLILNRKDYSLPKKNLIFSPHYKKILKEFEVFYEKVLKLMREYKFSLALEMIYKYFWFTFADKIIESLKPKINQKDKEAYFVCYLLLKNQLKLLHPFIPFLTEYLWEKIGQKSTLALEKLNFSKNL